MDEFVVGQIIKGMFNSELSDIAPKIYTRSHYNCLDSPYISLLFEKKNEQNEQNGGIITDLWKWKKFEKDSLIFFSYIDAQSKFTTPAQLVSVEFINFTIFSD